MPRIAQKSDTSTMLSRIRAASAAAREKGTLKSIETTSTVLQSNPPFLVRVLKKGPQKPGDGNNDPTGSAGPAKSNPFLPYEMSMFVQHLPPSHVLLLNKFNVVADHTLIVTRAFQEQSSLLTAADFAAMWMCLTDVAGLCFYNAGRVAGASQRHKHIQHIGGAVVGGGGGVTPFDGMVGGGVHGDGRVYAVAELGFVHAAVGMRDVARMAGRGETVAAGEMCMQRYTELLRTVGQGVDVGEMEGSAEMRQPFAYNLMATREWMMVVPRRKECFEGISVNSLGFVGCLLVRDEVQMEVVRRVGGMTVLREVAFSLL